MFLPVQLATLLLAISIANGKELLLDKESCAATGFGQPGFVSSRQFFPAGSEWDGVKKVAFQNSDCTWLAANFLDTGSEFVMILVLGIWADKSMHFIPSLAQALAADSNISTLALDFRGRGESCGVEILPGYFSGWLHARFWSMLLSRSYQELVQTNMTLLARAIPTDVQVLWINSRDGTPEEDLAAAGIRHLPNVIVNDLKFTNQLMKEARPIVLAIICELVKLERSRRGDEELRQVASKQQRTKLQCPVLPAGPALSVPFRFTMGQYNNYDGRGGFPTWHQSLSLFKIFS
ncbi:TPA: hypothetical protein ACH3X2_001222 [Trebouxia sp. C0005]